MRSLNLLSMSTIDFYDGLAPYGEFAHLRADVVPTGVFAAAEDFGGGDAGGSLSARVERAARELADAVTGRGRSGPVDPFANPTPFEELLHGAS